MLAYIWYSEEGWHRSQSPTRCTKTNSTPITDQCNIPVLWNMALHGVAQNRANVVEKVPDISRGSAATRVKSGGISSEELIANLPLYSAAIDSERF